MSVPGKATAFLNGAAVATSSTGGASPEIDLTRYVRQGRNILAAECTRPSTDGGWSWRMQIAYASGRAVELVSDDDVRASRTFSPGWQNSETDPPGFERAAMLRRDENVPATGGSQSPSNGRPTTTTTPPLTKPVEAKPTTPPASTALPTANFDFSRLVRVWDVNLQPGSTPRAGERMLLASAAPADPSEVSTLISAGVSLLQTEIDPLLPLEPQEGRWDLQRLSLDQQLARSAGLLWLPAPCFAYVPRWLQTSQKPTLLQCREHDRTLAAFSPWTSSGPAYAARGLQKLKDAFGDRSAGTILGVLGEYGEVGFPAGARISSPRQREDWRRIVGDEHNHLGWWSGDAAARQNFADWALTKYKTLAEANEAWKTNFRTPAEIRYPISPRDGARRWLDYMQWYQAGTAGYADRLMSAARTIFPNGILAVPMGFADENPRLGVDNSLIPKTAARHRAEVRSTHAGYRPFAQSQAGPMGRIASAARHYGVRFWTESTGRLTQDQVAERLFTDISLGASAHYELPATITAAREVYYRYARQLRVEKPIVDVAMLFPTTSHLLRGESGYPPVFAKGCSDIRDVLNYEIVDERMVQDGALASHRIAVMWEGGVWEKETLDRLRAWVEGGGILIAYDFGKIETVEGDRSWFTDLFGYAGRLAQPVVTRRFVNTGSPTSLHRYRVTVSDPMATPFLAGDWFDPETVDGTPARWTGASAVIRLPAAPRRLYELAIRAAVAADAPRKSREVLVNGTKVGELDRTGEYTYRFPISDAVAAGRDTLTVTVKSDTWVPAETLPNSSDRRALGLRLFWFQMDSTASAVEEPAPMPQGKFEVGIDAKKLKSDWARRLGQGWTVYFPASRAQLPGYYEVVRMLTYHAEELDPGLKSAIPVDDNWDGVYATLFFDRVLYYNSSSEPSKRSVTFTPRMFEGRRDVQEPAEMTQTLTVEPRSIGVLWLAPPEPEVLLQCEKFLELGGSSVQSGGAFYPGTGPSHVLLKPGAEISTRFQVDSAGRYRVFYRAVRRGAPASAEVLVDGKPAAPLSTLHARAGRQTECAGTVELSKGVHTLTLRPKRGEDLRADFVVLTTDTTIAGYGFGTKP
jgi:hypothetical protein